MHDYEFVTIGELGQVTDPFGVLDRAEELGKKTVNTVQDLLGQGAATMTQGTPPAASSPTGAHRAQVATQRDPLNLRDQPSTNGAIVGQLAKGAIVTYTATADGPGSTNGWAFCIGANGEGLGWASMDYLHNVDSQTPATNPPTVHGGGGPAVVAVKPAAPSDDNTLLYALGAGAVAGVLYLVLRKKKHAA